MTIPRIQLNSHEQVQILKFLGVTPTESIEQIRLQFINYINNESLLKVHLKSFYQKNYGKVKDLKGVENPLITLSNDPQGLIVRLFVTGKNFENHCKSCIGKSVEAYITKLRTKLAVDPKFLIRQDLNGDTFFHYILRNVDSMPSHKVHWHIQSILACKGSFQIKNKDGMTPLHLAAANGLNENINKDLFPSLVKEAEKRGFDFTQKDEKGRTVLHLTALIPLSRTSEFTNNLQILLNTIEKDRIDLNENDNLGFTALDYAFVMFKMGAVEALIEAGAQPLAGVCSRNIDDLLNRLTFFSRSQPKIKKGEDDISFYDLLTRYKNFYSAPLPDQLQCEINFFSSCFEKISNKMSLQFLQDKFKKLVRNISSDNINTQDCMGNTLLHAGALSNNPEIIKAILAKQPKTDLINVHGYTPAALTIKDTEMAFDAFMEAQVPLPKTAGKFFDGTPVPLTIQAALSCNKASLLDKIWNITMPHPNEPFNEIDEESEEEIEDIFPTFTYAETAMFFAIYSKNPYAVFTLIKRGLVVDTPLLNRLLSQDAKKMILF